MRALKAIPCLLLLFATDAIACSCPTWDSEDAMYRWITEQADAIFIGYPEVLKTEWQDGPRGREQVQIVQWSNVEFMKGDKNPYGPVQTKAHPLECGYIVTQDATHLVVGQFNDEHELRISVCFKSGSTDDRSGFIDYLNNKHLDEEVTRARAKSEATMQPSKSNNGFNTDAGKTGAG